MRHPDMMTQMEGFLLTSTQAQQGAIAAARSLDARGIRHGDLIALAPLGLPRGTAAAQFQAQTAMLVWGALRSGVLPVMINPLLTRAEQQRYLAQLQLAGVFSRPAEIAHLTEPQRQLAPAPDLAEVPLGRPIHFTSGTTGIAKPVSSGVLTDDLAGQYWHDEAQQWPIVATDRLLNHGPLAHSAPLRFVLLAMQAGADVLFTGNFDLTRIRAALARWQPTVAMAAPAHLQRLLAQPELLPSSSYRILAHAGSSCAPELKRAIHRWAGAEQVWEFLGSTEGQFTACRGTEWEQRPGTLGRARRGRQLLIDDGSMRSAGLIWCETPAYARFEYLGSPEKTAACWHATKTGMAFTVGDVGRLDDHGYLYLAGRRSDLIITGGVNVYPMELEGLLRDCPAIADVVVYSRPDPHWGEAVCAALVLAKSPDPDPYAADSHTTAAQLRRIKAWVSQNLANYRRPRRLDLVAELPYTATGKIRRDELPDYVDAHTLGHLS